MNNASDLQIALPLAVNGLLLAPLVASDNPFDFTNVLSNIKLPILVTGAVASVVLQSIFGVFAFSLHPILATRTIENIGTVMNFSAFVVCCKAATHTGDRRQFVNRVTNYIVPATMIGLLSGEFFYRMT